MKDLILSIHSFMSDSHEPCCIGMVIMDLNQKIIDSRLFIKNSFCSNMPKEERDLYHGLFKPNDIGKSDDNIVILSAENKKEYIMYEEISDFIYKYINRCNVVFNHAEVGLYNLFYKIFIEWYETYISIRKMPAYFIDLYPYQQTKKYIDGISIDMDLDPIHPLYKATINAITYIKMKKDGIFK